MLNISQVILMRTDSNLCRKVLTVHWSAPNSLIRSYLQPCTNSIWGDESEAVAPIIWLYQIVDAQKEDVFFPELLITLRSYVTRTTKLIRRGKHLHQKADEVKVPPTTQHRSLQDPITPDKKHQEITTLQILQQTQDENTTRTELPPLQQARTHS